MVSVNKNLQKLKDERRKAKGLPPKVSSKETREIPSLDLDFSSGLSGANVAMGRLGESARNSGLAIQDSIKAFEPFKGMYKEEEEEFFPQIIQAGELERYVNHWNEVQVILANGDTFAEVTVTRKVSGKEFKMRISDPQNVTRVLKKISATQNVYEQTLSGNVKL